MPTYSYACKDCGRNMDIFQSFDEDSLTVCPECGGNLRKKFNSVGVVFKGSGFYRNDSRGSTTSASAPATAAASATSGSSDSSSSASSSSDSSSASSAPASTSDSSSSASSAASTS
ncbi:FmdB family zinc ribbon protein [Neomicrococcus lactis]|uniref:FmdB family zinc ribbon protein n=1 Tax=Neomicrococcus lactis TaxID=732241 RepID=UPI002301090E|nr:FmdB family zinc ribbon protein [Neomicrococcus lactis]